MLLNKQFYLWAGPVHCDDLVLRHTDRTSPSRLTFVPTINANGQKARGAFHPPSELNL